MKRTAFSILELILAVALFVIFASGMITSLLNSLNLSRLGHERSIATLYAQQGLEAARSIKNQSFSLLTTTAQTGIVQVGGVWALSGTDNSFGKYTRTISIADVYRDTNGNVVQSGGTLDGMSKYITSTVNWGFAPGKERTVSTSTYLTNWKLPFGKGGKLAYADSTNGNDRMRMKTLSADQVTWSDPIDLADVDATTNRVPRVVRIYSSPTRNESVVVSRHYNGTTQYIYAQIFNGSTWGNVQLLSSWNSTALLDVQNFDGTYQENGTFVIAYSDNTSTPKFRTWNGSAWSGQVSMRALTGTPYHIVLRARPSSNEIMFVSLDSANDTSVQYFNGGTYITNNWTNTTDLGTNTTTNTRRVLDFAWSTNNPLTGTAIFANSTTDKTIRARIFVANGTGGGSWGGTVSSTAQTNNVGAMRLTSSSSSPQFLACNKDTATTPTVVCRQFSFSGSSVTWSNPTNPIVAVATDTGLQASFDTAFESTNGTEALIVYGDTTNTPKAKLYSQSGNTISASPTSLSTSPFALSAPLKTVELIADPNGDNIIIFIGDNALDLISLAWNGSSNTTSSVVQHTQVGSTTTGFWYHFAWDAY